jgi:O-antigen ligase
LTFDTSKIDDSGRDELVTNLINNYVFKNPIFGNGVDFAMSQRAHNTVIGVWADAGIFALIFFLFMLGKYFMKTLARPPNVRYFVLPILITLYIFMVSLQSVINQPYLMALFVYLGYIIDDLDQASIVDKVN